jgi:hypothetical protein
MIRAMASAVVLVATLSPVIASAAEPDDVNRACQRSVHDAPKLVCDGGDRERFEAAVNDVLRHLDAGDHASLAAEILAGDDPENANQTRSEIEPMAATLKQVAERVDADSGRRFASIDLFARVEGARHDPKARYAAMNHFRICDGRFCREEVVMKEVDGGWQLFGLHLYVETAPAPEKGS